MFIPNLGKQCHDKTAGSIILIVVNEGKLTATMANSIFDHLKDLCGFEVIFLLLFNRQPS